MFSVALVLSVLSSGVGVDAAQVNCLFAEGTVSYLCEQENIGAFDRLSGYVGRKEKMYYGVDVM